MALAGEALVDGPLPPFFAPPPDRLAISLGQFSSAGVKLENQDFHGALQPEGADLSTKGIAIALADGISTSKLGATAAETAVKSFLSDYYCTSPAWSVQTSAVRVISATNGWMYSQNTGGRILSDEERESGLICTFSALVLKSRSAHVFHVGDARIASISRGRIEPLTQAHRVSLGGGESYLARALGMDRHIEIDYHALPLHPGDIFMLSTDGVYEFLSDGKIQQVLADAETLDEAAKALADAALAEGSKDNLTVQLVRIDGLPRGEIEDLVGPGISLPPAPQLTGGDEFEGYKILRQLHAGSRSHVYLARDEADGARVALKVPSTEHAEDKAQLASLELEEWVMRRISHQNVLRAAPMRRARRHLYSVAEYVEGQTLDEWMHDNFQPELSVVRDIVRQAASGLLALHRREMLHRDLRPQNLMIDADGTVRIIDFGSVKVAGIDEIAADAALDSAYAGTLQYSAPELYQGEPASQRSDLFSLGVIAYQMLTGELPYGNRPPSTLTKAALRKLQYRPARAINPAVPEWMDAAIAKAVALDPRGRYEELSEFTYDLAHPNKALVESEVVPVLQRGSAEFWRIIAGILALALAISIFTRPDVGNFPTTNQQEQAQ